MNKYSAISMLTCCALAAACGGSNNESKTGADVSARGSAEGYVEPSVEPGTEALAPSPISADPNATQVTLDSVLAERCGIKEAKVYFPYDSAEVQSNSDTRVRSMADCLVSRDLAGKQVVLVGHTDPRGTEQYNEGLGRSRAETIAELLIAAGLPKDKVVVKSEGESDASPDRDEWPRDRRVEIALIED